MSEYEKLLGLVDCNGAPLKVGASYLLRTYTMCGSIEPPSKWVSVFWDGSNLIDSDGDSWNEWLPTPEEIYPA